MLTFTAFYFYSWIYNYLCLLPYWKPSKHCSYKQEAHMSLYCSTGKEDLLNKLAIEHVIILISLSQDLKYPGSSIGTELCLHNTSLLHSKYN